MVCLTVLLSGVLIVSRTATAQFVILKEKPFEGEGFNNLIRAEAGAAIAYLNLYPDRDLYFLARDATRLAQITKEVGEIIHLGSQDRIHILDISVVSKSDPHLPDYLKSEGLSEAAFEAGKRITVFDTGFLGSIPDALLSIIPEKYHSQVRVQMLESTTREYPSLKSFGLDAGPIRFFLGSGYVPDQFYAVGLYAGLPKSHGKTTGYKNSGEKWIAQFKDANDQIITDPNEEVSPEKEIDLWEKTQAALRQPEMLAWIAERNSLWNQAIAETKVKIAKGESTLVRDSQFSLYKTILRDAAEVLKMTAPKRKPYKFPEGSPLPTLNPGCRVMGSLS